MDVLLETPPLRNVTHFFRLFILQALSLSVVKKYKSTLGAKPGADNNNIYILEM